MRTEVNLSPQEESIKADWLNTTKSIRQIGRDHGVSDAWVRKLSKKHNWRARPTAGSQPGARTGSQSRAVMVVPSPPTQQASSDAGGSGSEQDQDGVGEAIRKAARSDPKELVDDTREILARLRDELDAVTSHVGELEEMIEEATAGEKDPRRYDAMMRAISLPTRILAAKNLALAMKTLTEAAPGKKESANRAAETAGRGSGWGDDLDVGIGAGRPN